MAPSLTVSGTGIVPEGSAYTLSLGASDPGNDTISSWTVDWGDGSPAGMPSGNPVSVEHAYADNAVYTISISAADEDGNYEAGSHLVTVTNVAPNAAAIMGLPEGSIEIKQPITVSAAFIDPGLLDAPTATIDWGDGKMNSLKTSELEGGVASATYAYSKAGTYTVTVTVSDKDGATGTSTGLVTVIDPQQPPVVNEPPEVGPVTGLPDDPVNVKVAVTLSASFSDPDSGDTHTATIDWGDGTISKVEAADLTVTGSHAYNKAGGYTVTVTVTDRAGATDTSSDTVTVIEVPKPPKLPKNAPQSLQVYEPAPTTKPRLVEETTLPTEQPADGTPVEFPFQDDEDS